MDATPDWTSPAPAREERPARAWLLPVLLVAATLLGSLLWWSLSRPTVLRVAVPGAGDPGARVVAAFARTMTEQEADVRLKVLPFASVEESARALQQGKVDLAVVRPDVFLPGNGHTVAILREEELLILGPSRDVADLADRRVGVVLGQDADLAMVGNVLAFHDVPTSSIKLQPLAPGDAFGALASRQVEALAAVLNPGQAASDFVAAARRAVGRDLAVVSLDESAAMGAEWPAFAEVRIAAGTLGGRPRQPVEDVRTTSVSYRLMADSELDRDQVADLAEYLFQMRTRIAKQEPLINLMRAPDTDSATSAALPVHPGAVDYLVREQQTFMDRYGDWLWLALFAGGGLSSVAAWAVQAFARRRRRREDAVLEHLLDIAARARRAVGGDALDALAEEMQGLIAQTVRQARASAPAPSNATALILAIDAARAAIHDRRRALASGSDAQPSISAQAACLAETGVQG